MAPVGGIHPPHAHATCGRWCLVMWPVDSHHWSEMVRRQGFVGTDFHTSVGAHLALFNPSVWTIAHTQPKWVLTLVAAEP